MLRLTTLLSTGHGCFPDHRALIVLGYYYHAWVEDTSISGRFYVCTELPPDLEHVDYAWTVGLMALGH